MDTRTCTFSCLALLLACTPEAQNVVDTGLTDASDDTLGDPASTSEAGTTAGSGTATEGDATEGEGESDMDETGDLEPVPVTCEQTPAMRLDAVWGTARDDVFAVGGSGTILHYDGSRWSEMESGTTADLRGVWGTASDDVFVMGGNRHWNGSTWSGGSGPNIYRKVWGNGPNDVFAAGSQAVGHNDGSGWSTFADSTVLGEDTFVEAMWTSGPDDVIVGGFILDHARAVTFARLLRWDGDQWSVVFEDSRPHESVVGIWGTGPDDVWAVTTVSDYEDVIDDVRGRVLHWDGRAWEVVTVPHDHLHFRAVSGRAAGDVVVVGFDVVLHFDGAQWDEPEGFSGGTSVWVAPDLFTVTVSSGGTACAGHL
jgi:hypothetical protein